MFSFIILLDEQHKVPDYITVTYGKYVIILTRYVNTAWKSSRHNIIFFSHAVMKNVKLCYYNV